jgi:trehalose/maltose hydrolase-like predicted phosphorylase
LNVWRQGYDGARFATVAASEKDCFAQVVSYVAEQAGRQLWPSSALRVHGLLAAGDAAAAVTEYFRQTGERWDREWLFTTSLNPGLHSTAWSGAIPLPKFAHR